MFGRPGISLRVSTTRTLLSIVVLFTTLFGVSYTHAQVLYGSITGTVTDKSGAVIPGAAVTITNEGTGEARTIAAKGAGSYALLDLQPGVYTVSIPAKGNFGAYTERDIQVEVNRQVRVDVTLQPAAVTAQVMVSEAPPSLQTETAEVNSEISQTELSQLPITSSEGRNFQSLYTLIPGASAVQEKNSVGGNPARAMSANVNGNSYNGNTTRIDGAVNYYGWLPYLIAYVPPADSIESVSFTTNAFNAEQGQAGGASVKITTKSGTRNFHGSAWEYYQDAALNARPYSTPGTIPKNVYQEYGGNVGGPIYIPRLLTGRKKLFFFTNFDRITRRQLITNTFSVPDANMITGNFSEVASGLSKGNTVLYDPAPTVPSSEWIGTVNPTLCPTLSYTSGYLNYSCRPSFTNEYGETGSSVNTIPASRIASAASIMMKNLQPFAALVGSAGQPAASLSNQLLNDYIGRGTFGYNRNAFDTKITYAPNENTQVFGKYGISPYTGTDAQIFGQAGGTTVDGGQPGAAAGRAQNVGLGMSHAFSASFVIDADFGYTRQVTGAQSTVDLSLGDYGISVLGIPGTNGPGPNYEGEPAFDFYTQGSTSNTFSGLGNVQGANPFLFRDNQFTGDVNLSWVKGKHSTKYGFTYYHFDLNHFQPTSGGGINSVRGGFEFAGGMTCGLAASATTASCSTTGYNNLADFLLGLPNNGTTSSNGGAVAKPSQVFNPNSLRWTELGGYAQDQWAVTPKFTLNYGVRYEVYPPAYRDHTGVTVLVPGLPQSANVEVGGENGNPENAGIYSGFGSFAPRLGIDYRLTEKTVVRSGFGITTDPDSMRYLRDEYPEDLAPAYTGTGTGTIAVDPANTTNYPNGQPMTLTYGIPAQIAPNLSAGFVSLPISGSTTTVAQNFRRGYIESWNLFIQRDLGLGWVGNIGYVGTHFVRQQVGWTPFNSAPFPSTATPCMPNGQYNTALTGKTGPCSFSINETINWQNCSATWTACYNTGGITMTQPLWSSSYNAMQSQLTHSAGRNMSLGVVYTYSHAIDFEDNGAGSGAGGTTFNYPAMAHLNRATAGYDQKHNAQVYGIYSLPFGYGQKFANQGLVAQIIGGFQLNGQFSHYSGTPFSVNAAGGSQLSGEVPGFGTTYAQLVAPYQQESGHNRTPGASTVSGGKPWFNPASFANPTEPPATVAGNPSNTSPTLPNTHRNEFRGPGVSVFNASIFRAFHVYRESEFQIRFEAFNLLNHPILTSNPNATVGGGTFGYITSFGPGYSPTQGSRSLQFSGRFNF